jgi:hypothetical protein
VKGEEKIEGMTEEKSFLKEREKETLKNFLHFTLTLSLSCDGNLLFSIRVLDWMCSGSEGGRSQ